MSSVKRMNEHQKSQMRVLGFSRTGEMKNRIQKLIDIFVVKSCTKIYRSQVVLFNLVDVTSVWVYTLS